MTETEVVIAQAPGKRLVACITQNGGENVAPWWIESAYFEVQQPTYDLMFHHTFSDIAKAILFYNSIQLTKGAEKTP